jgi:hypothetical protein
LFLLARELGVTPDKIKEKPFNEVQKWLSIQGAINEAKESQVKKQKGNVKKP